MTVAAIRDAIVAKLQLVPDIGVVHNHERFAKDATALKQLYYSAPHATIRGWFVRHPTIAETDQHMYESVQVARWTIRGYLGFRDSDDASASEIVAASLIEQIRDVFRADGTVGGTVAQCALPFGGQVGESGIQVDQFEPVMFTDVLCHCVGLRLNTVNYLTHNP